MEKASEIVLRFDKARFKHKDVKFPVVSSQELLEKIMPKPEKYQWKLQDVVRNWTSVVGPARGRYSSPCDLVEGTLYVVAGSPHVAQQITQMKGNIQRILKNRWDLDVNTVQVSLTPPPVKPSVARQGPRRRAPIIELEESEVQALRERCPDSLTSEAAGALAHLRAFFVRRFARRA